MAKINLKSLDGTLKKHFIKEQSALQSDTIVHFCWLFAQCSTHGGVFPIVVWLVEVSDLTGIFFSSLFFSFPQKNKRRTCGCVYLHARRFITCTFPVYMYSKEGGASHPGGAPVPGVGGRDGRGAAAPLGRAGALQHAGLEAGMAPGVLRQVVAPHEALVAQRAVEALLARVRAVVAGQLVRPGELLAAVGPGALEGPLSCGGTHTKAS